MIVLYVNIIAVLSLFIGYFIPKLSGDLARLFREAPQLFLPEPRVCAAHRRLGRSNLGAGEAGDLDTATPRAPSIAELPREIVVEPMPNGKFRIDLDNVAFEVHPLRGGRYVIAPPRSEEAETLTRGKWERSIKQWLTERLKSTEGESRRALEYGQIRDGDRRRHRADVSGADGSGVHPGRSAAHPGVPAVAGSQTYQLDYERIVAGIDRGLSGVIRGQLVICFINGVFTYIGLLVFHVKYPLLLAGIAATMSLVPIFGSILSSVPIVAIGLDLVGHVRSQAGAVRAGMDYRHPPGRGELPQPEDHGRGPSTTSTSPASTGNAAASATGSKSPPRDGSAGHPASEKRTLPRESTAATSTGRHARE